MFLIRGHKTGWGKLAFLIRGHKPGCQHFGAGWGRRLGGPSRWDADILFPALVLLPFSASGIPESEASQVCSTENETLVSMIGMWVEVETWLLAVRECAWGGSNPSVYRPSITFPIFNLCLALLALVSVIHCFIPVVLLGSWFTEKTSACDSYSKFNSKMVGRFWRAVLMIKRNLLMGFGRNGGEWVF